MLAATILVYFNPLSVPQKRSFTKMSTCCKRMTTMEFLFSNTILKNRRIVSSGSQTKTVAYGGK